MEALPGREPERGPRRARTPSVSTSMGTTTETTVASWDKRSPQQTDSNLFQIATAQIRTAKQIGQRYFLSQPVVELPDVFRQIMIRRLSAKSPKKGALAVF